MNDNDRMLSRDEMRDRIDAHAAALNAWKDPHLFIASLEAAMEAKDLRRLDELLGLIHRIVLFSPLTEDEEADRERMVAECKALATLYQIGLADLHEFTDTLVATTRVSYPAIRRSVLVAIYGNVVN